VNDDARGAFSAVPLATYRLQFGPRFRFDDARAIVPYLAELGVGHLYASPYLKARPGSEHGYDITDPNALNPEIGTPEEHAALIASAQSAGLGHLLDIVPNHMGVGKDNPWWYDVLEWGEGSPYAAYFDVDWNPSREDLRGKVLLPFLGDYYGRIIERGELVPTFDPRRGTFAIDYFERRFPLAPTTYPALLASAAERHGGSAWALRALAAEFARTSYENAPRLKAELADAAADPENAAAIEAALETFRVGGEAGAIERLDALIAEQAYRLSYWRVSADEINYRRFFDINDLAGVRVEDASVLAATHRLIFAMIAAGALQGVRVDHVDGLFDPTGYCALLHERAAALGHPQYLVVEKILARFESMRPDWNVAGSTGYDFMNLVNGLFVDPKAELAFDRLYRRFAGIGTSFDQFAYRAKKDIMRSSLASELEVLVTMLHRIACRDRRSSDYTFNVLRDALTEVIASFPVYRTYVTSERLEDEDRRFIELAVAAGRKRSDLGDARVFDFIERALTVALPEDSPRYERSDVLRFAMKFQQYTSPVMAKAVEDTAFYRYVRLASLNEVGGDPRRFGTSVEEFHRANAERARLHPHAMLATATHDHKRGEDVRTRIDALTDVPGAWERALRRWGRANVRHKSGHDGALAPTENDEYLIYQTLLGTWPAPWLDGGVDAIPDDDREAYLERIDAYVRKATREAKFRTSWTNPDETYERATSQFLRELLRPRRGNAFLRELHAFARELAPLSAVASLAQVVLKLTSPGVPDVYQGTELWDLSLVDPDNRRRVDYALRARMLDEMRARADAGDARGLATDLLRSWTDGRIKAYVTWRLLHLRRERPETFLDGGYAALDVDGAAASHLVAFARERIVIVVPRLVRERFERRADGTLGLAFGDETVRLDAAAPVRYRDVFTDAVVEAVRDPNGLRVRAADLFATLPVAVLVPAP
jgi:(1->4)-alpha-D-glucan 1-alpha-D-glucosylmutase